MTSSYKSYTCITLVDTDMYTESIDSENRFRKLDLLMKQSGYILICIWWGWEGRWVATTAGMLQWRQPTRVGNPYTSNHTQWAAQLCCGTAFHKSAQTGPRTMWMAGDISTTAYQRFIKPLDVYTNPFAWLMLLIKTVFNVLNIPSFLICNGL